MALDPQVQKLLEFINLYPGKPMHEMSAPEAREVYNSRPANLSPDHTEVFKLINKTVEHNGIQNHLRIYIPTKADESLAVLVFYHGGGMVIGSINSYDTLCRQLAVQSNCIIVSVDYRLAPENKFPAAVDDAFNALKWVHKNAKSFNGDATKLAVGGDSAGGSLAAVTAILARDANIPLRFQLLIYPATAPHADHESHLKYAHNYFLDRPTILWFHDCYLRTEADRQDFRYAPLILEDLSELAPAYIVVAEYDPLRDEGVAYANRLRDAGVTIELEEFKGMIHPFLSLAGILDQGKSAISSCAKQLKKHLYT